MNAGKANKNNIKLSIIVIGRNEGWKLSRCFDSVFKTIDHNNLKSFEIIYVDSKSNDDSVKIAKQYKIIKIIELTGDVNSAIGRNVGAKIAQGDILFFLDGDMELIPTIFSIFYTEEKGIEYPFISGNLLYIYYDHEWNLLKDDNKPHYEEIDQKMPTVGGLFFISSKLWGKFQGMRDYLKAGEDGDLALRLMSHGIPLLRKKEVLVYHHTIHYLDSARKWEFLFSGRLLYSKSLLYRNHIFRLHCLKRLLRHDYSSIVLILSVLLIFITHSLFSSILYFLLILIRCLNKEGNFFNNYIYYVTRDFMIICGFIFFYPTKNKNVVFKLENKVE